MTRLSSAQCPVLRPRVTNSQRLPGSRSRKRDCIDTSKFNVDAWQRTPACATATAGFATGGTPAILRPGALPLRHFIS